MSKKEPQIKVFEVLMVDVVLEVLVRVAPFLSFVSILSLRCTNKKLHTVFSRKVVWKALGFPPEEVRDDPSMPWDSGFLMFLNLWDFETEKKKVHLTPWRKGITGVAQGALRWISYTGDMRQGVLKAGCMPSVKWTKRKLVSGDTDNPYILSCSFANGQPGTISCGCPVGCGDVFFLFFSSLVLQRSGVLLASSSLCHRSSLDQARTTSCGKGTASSTVF